MDEPDGPPKELTDKERKKKYGITLQPIECTEAWVREMAFDHNSKGVITKSYILLNRYTGYRTHINTYNGQVGVGVDTRKYTFLTKGFIERDKVKLLKDLTRVLCVGKSNEYQRCQVADCPIAVLVAGELNRVEFNSISDLIEILGSLG